MDTMNLPVIEKGWFCLVRAQRTTGHIVNNDGSVYCNLGANYYLLFPNEQELELYVHVEIEKYADFEYIVYGADGVLIKTIC